MSKSDRHKIPLSSLPQAPHVVDWAIPTKKWGLHKTVIVAKGSDISASALR